MGIWPTANQLCPSVVVRKQKRHPFTSTGRPPRPPSPAPFPEYPALNLKRRGRLVRGGGLAVFLEARCRLRNCKIARGWAQALIWKECLSAALSSPREDD